MHFKTCKMCGAEKATSLFRLAVGYKNGIFSRCRQCESDTATAWYHANKERAKTQRQEFKKKHPELEYQRTKSWRARNPGRFKVQIQRRRAIPRVREMLAAWASQWRRTPKGRANQARSNHRRRMAELVSPPPR